MSIHRRAARNDANQAAVIEALESIGCLVYVIRQPVDLLIGVPGDQARWVIAEVKDGGKPPSARKLRPSQVDAMDMAAYCNLPAVVMTSPQQAIEAVRKTSQPDAKRQP